MAFSSGKWGQHHPPVFRCYWKATHTVLSSGPGTVRALSKCSCTPGFFSPVFHIFCQPPVFPKWNSVLLVFIHYLFYIPGHVTLRSFCIPFYSTNGSSYWEDDFLVLNKWLLQGFLISRLLFLERSGKCLLKKRTHLQALFPYPSFLIHHQALSI